jgi:hypothetical protein
MPTGLPKLKPEPTALRVRRRGRWWLALIAVIAMITMTARAAGATRAERPWATGPTGAHARGKWSTRKYRPRSRRRALGALRTERAVYAVVVMVLVMPSDRGAGEEDHRDHEDDACDDHHPRRGLIKARVLCRVRRRARRRLDRGFGCFGHALIMPTHGPAINQLHA